MVERRIRWGDSLDEDDSLPPRTEEVDKEGIKTVVEYHKNDLGKVIKTTTKTKTIVERKKIYEVRGGQRRPGGSLKGFLSILLAAKLVIFVCI